MSQVTHHVTGDITHQCLAAAACRAATNHTNPTTGRTERIGATTEKPNSICRRCYAAIRIATEDLPQDYQDLADAIGDHQPIQGEKVHGTSDMATPLDLVKNALMDDIAQTLANAADRITTLTGRRPQDTRGQGHHAHIRARAHHIRNNIGALLNSPAEPEEQWVGQGESIQYRDPETGRLTWKPNTQITMRTGIDTALKLVELSSRARARLAGVTNNMWRLPINTPGCINCGESLYTDGHKVICRACARDWTENTFGLIQRQVREDEERMIEQLKTQLAEAITQRDQAWERLDRASRLANALREPEWAIVAATQTAGLIDEILDGHPTIESRTTTTEPEAD